MDERTALRFWAKVDKAGPVPACRPDLGPCWLWEPAVAAGGGYGQIVISGKWWLAHRLAFVLAGGIIPPKYQVDHLCKVRFCVNPRHLEAVTQAENLRRARAWENGAAFQRNKTHCKCGEPYAGENLVIYKSGKRGCRSCNRRTSAESAARKRAA